MAGRPPAPASAPLPWHVRRAVPCRWILSLPMLPSVAAFSTSVVQHFSLPFSGPSEMLSRKIVVVRPPAFRIGMARGGKASGDERKERQRISFFECDASSGDRSSLFYVPRKFPCRRLHFATNFDTFVSAPRVKMSTRWPPPPNASRNEYDQLQSRLGVCIQCRTYYHGVL